MNLKLTGLPSDTHSGGDNRPGRDHIQEQAQSFTGRPSDTPVVETTGQAKCACNTPSSGTDPEARQQPKACATRMHAPAAPAFAAPQPLSTRSAQRRSVTFHCDRDNRPGGDHLRHSVSLVCPATPRWWRQPARRSTPAACRARAPAPMHCNNPGPTRLGCTPRRPLHPRRHSLRPPGQPSDAQ